MIEPHCLTNGVRCCARTVSGRFPRPPKMVSRPAKMVSSEPLLTLPGRRRRCWSDQLVGPVTLNRARWTHAEIVCITPLDFNLSEALVSAVVSNKSHAADTIASSPCWHMTDAHHGRFFLKPYYQ